MLSSYSLWICYVWIVKPGRHKKGRARGDVKEKRERHTWYKNPFFALCLTNFLWSDYIDGQLTVNTFTNTLVILSLFTKTRWILQNPNDKPYRPIQCFINRAGWGCWKSDLGIIMTCCENVNYGFQQIRIFRLQKWTGGSSYGRCTFPLPICSSFSLPSHFHFDTCFAGFKKR